ncbi:hypothetical protein [Nocardia donostiensis]|uniref:Uncharacterized protein n=1 Tax=Nocardia donostiensis TaxID=1538463 RepID=A0A1W0B377_9NOCA|nr:hypothetical protein [Nocardia donostiensis]ONM46561.1 hypothetical protein B0T46_22565 [Nocardia donostiensis]OQS16955.1 hypothetical protein B0T36_03485 [Nocardia donostiensis]OQS23336.1 hypothetical protein B0T44_02800 [Nocardia donostiensis]
MVTVYANQAVVRAEDLPDVIRAAEVLNLGVRIENVLVPDDEGGYSLEWIVTRDEEAPAYEDWEGRYRETDDTDGDAITLTIGDDGDIGFTVVE